MGKIYYAITPSFCNVTRYVPAGDFNSVYDRIMFITDDNHDVAANAQGWCELAAVGEIYEDDNFTIKIIDDAEEYEEMEL